MGALLHSLHDHKPLPSWAPPPAAPSVASISTTPLDRKPPARDQYAVRMHGDAQPIFCTYSSDEDGAWVDLLECWGVWFEAEQIHRPEWIAAFNAALCAQLLSDAADEAQP